METVHSDWDDWLPQRIAAAAPDGLTVWYLGCNGVACKAADGTTVFVDPYCGTGSPPRTVRMVPIPFDPADVERADAVLATHEHSDHVHGPTQAPLVARGAAYHAPDESLAVVSEENWVGTYDLDADRFRGVAAGDVLTVGGITVHVRGGDDPDAVDPVSYVLEYDGRTFFHGGDARPGAPFERVGRRHDVDLAALAFGSSGYVGEGADRSYTTWYSDESEVVRAAEQVGATRLLPTHWDMWRGLTADPSAVVDHARSFESPDSVEIARIGDAVTV
jgi:L-ascorbate 6-phosphate lactonase